MAELVHADRRAQLEEERRRLVHQLRDLGVAVDDEPGGISYDEGFADIAQVTAERGEVEALAGTLSEALNEVDHALAKIDAGSYGRCEQCGDEISPARLEAMPAARFCIDHAARH